MIALSSGPLCLYDSHQAGLLYLPAGWRDTTPGIDVLALAPGTLEWPIFPSQRMNVGLTLVDVEELVDV
jgi:hypothetical protein